MIAISSDRSKSTVDDELLRSHLVAPSERFAPLYGRVATLPRFAGVKFWADAIPNKSASAIMEDFHKSEPMDGSAIEAFVLRHFALPVDAPHADAAPPAEKPNRDLVSHIDLLWDHLTRTAPQGAAFGSSHIPLPRPYVVPGGMFRELYYWDSYFTVIGFGPHRMGLARDIAENFASLIERFGHIPNGNRTYYLSRSQPPLFFMLADFLKRADPTDTETDYLPFIQQEYAFWTESPDRTVALQNGSTLSRYWDQKDTPRDESYAIDLATAAGTSTGRADVFRHIRAAAESGWDFSSRWFRDYATIESICTTDIFPIDLNAILFGMETYLANEFRDRGQIEQADNFRGKANLRRGAINRYLWNDELGVYSDFDIADQSQRLGISAAAFYPLFFGCASQQQAASVVLEAQKELWAPGGLLTTAKSTGHQWDAPNGWAPLHWIAIKGMMAYGFNSEAQDLARRWLGTVLQVFEESGRLVEKYDLLSKSPGDGGEYPLQDGFGWTNGVTAALIAEFPEIWRDLVDGRNDRAVIQA